jgi:hypothetical protein
MKLPNKSIPILLVASFGCAELPRQKAKLDLQLREESKALTTAVVDALQLQPAQQRDRYTATALQFARQDQQLEGFPLQPFELPALLDTNAPTHASAAKSVQQRFHLQNKLLARRVALDQELIHLGTETAQARVQSRKFWARVLPIIGLPIAALALLSFSFPLLGRFLGWIVSKLPVLAASLGVVSLKAFDALVRAIEKTRYQYRTAPAAPTVLPGLSNENSRRGGEPTSWLEALELNLSRALDLDHKRLVRARKNHLV